MSHLKLVGPYSYVYHNYNYVGLMKDQVMNVAMVEMVI